MTNLQLLKLMDLLCAAAQIIVEIDFMAAALKERLDGVDYVLGGEEGILADVRRACKHQAELLGLILDLLPDESDERRMVLPEPGVN